MRRLSAVRLAFMPKSNDDTTNNEPPKEERIEFLAPSELAEQLRTKAKKRGWSLGAVLRALSALWVEEDIVSAEDVGKQTERAPKTKKKKPESAKK